MSESGRYAVISTMKNEGPYILEWVAHYKALGFDEIVVCTNDCEDTTVEILKRLEHLGHVHHHNTRVGRAGIHRSALRQASRMEVVRSSDWIFVCDADEFLNIHVGDGSVRTLVRLSGADADVISVPWRIFGSSNISLYRDRLVTDQFRMAEAEGSNPEGSKFVKSLFTGPERFQRIGLHAPVVDTAREWRPVTVLPGGARYLDGTTRTETPPHWDIAQVNHYALRSLDSFLIKRDRGRANHMNQVIGLNYWHRFDFNCERDDSIARYDAAKGAWLARFRADEALAFLHRKSVRWHNWKARQLRSVPEMKALRLHILNLMSEAAAAKAADEKVVPMRAAAE